jgi:hypothetical protein
LKKLLAFLLLMALLSIPCQGHSAFDPKKGGVCVTDDDGEKYACQKFLALAATYKVKVSLGIIVQRLEDQDPDSISWDELRAGLSQGFLQVASHTMTHRDLTTLSAADLDWELKESKRLLELRLNTRIDTIFYPFGEYNATVLHNASLYYKYGRRGYPDETIYNTPPFHFYELEVMSVRSYHSPEEVINNIDAALQGGKLLILVFHTIVPGTPADEYEYNEGKLEQIILYLSQHAPTLTISEAMESARALPAIYLLLLGNE